jgi:hypothetical protein
MGVAGGHLGGQNVCPVAPGANNKATAMENLMFDQWLRFGGCEKLTVNSKESRERILCRKMQSGYEVFSRKLVKMHSV